MNPTLQGASQKAASGKRPSPFTLSIVVPAFNEEKGIVQTAQTLCGIAASIGRSYEIIVVDDGSSDFTYRLTHTLSSEIPQVKGIRLSRNFGKESAILAGLAAARGDAVITIDADLQHPPALIPQMVQKWMDGADIVNGVKGNRLDTPLLRWRAALFNTLITKTAGININHSSDFKLLDRHIVDVIVTDLKEYHRFYRGLTDWIGFKQEMVVFDVAPRSSGNSKWSMRSLISLAMTATITFTSAPLRIVTCLGLLTLVMAAVLTAETLFSRVRGYAVSGFATLEISLLLIGSFIMISLGIIGEYIAKIYDELKNRPPFLIDHSFGINEEQDNDD